MRMLSTSRSNLDLLLLFGPLPALVALAAAAVIQAVPLLTVLAIAIVAYAVLVAGTLEARKDTRTATLAAPAERRPALELMNTIPLVIAQATIGVASTTGVCPLGFRQGSTWAIHQDGNLTHPLCRPAVEALSPLLRAGATGQAGTQVACQCPFADQEVVFSIAMDRRQDRSAQPLGARG